VVTAINRLEARISAQGMNPLSAPAGYFRWQLGELHKNPPPQQAIAPAPTSKKVAGPSVMERFLTARAADALAVHKNLDEKERKVVFDEFKEQHKGSVVKFDRGLESAMVRALFTRWYANTLWGEPSAEALASFIEKSAA